MNIKIRVENVKKYVFGYSKIDDVKTVENWQDSNILSVPEEDTYFCFGKNRKNNHYFGFPVYATCDTTSCKMFIDKIRRLPTGQTCKVYVDSIKRLPVQVASKTVTAVVAVSNSNASTSGMTEAQICSSFGSSAQQKETFYYRSDLVLANGVSLYYDDARTLPIEPNKTLGLIIDDKQFTFKSGADGKITALTECIYESNSVLADGLFYTSYFEWVGNVATEKKFTNKTDLFNTMVNPMPVFQAVVNNISTSGVNTVDIGDQIFINNVQITGNYFLGYFTNETPYFIRVSDSLVAETGQLSAPSVLSGTTVLFPKLTRTEDPNNKGYGFLSREANYFRHKLNVGSDGKTLTYTNISTNGQPYISYYEDKQFTVTPWYRINKGARVYGIPSPFVIPDSLIGSVFTLICSADVSYNGGTVTPQIKAIIANIVTEINGVFIIKAGQ